MLHSIGGIQDAARRKCTGLTKSTFSLKAAEVSPQWILIDAENVILGRLATIVASRLQGKHRPDFTPHICCGDYVIIINAEKISVTGRKVEQKQYYRHTGYIGGIKKKSLKATLEGAHPERALEDAVWGMLKRGPLAREQFRRLRVYKGPNHPHVAQQPIVFDVVALNDKNSKEGLVARNPVKEEIEGIQKDIREARVSITSLTNDSKDNTKRLADVSVEVSAIKSSLSSIEQIQSAELKSNQEFRREASDFQNRASQEFAEIRKNTAELADIRKNM